MILVDRLLAGGIGFVLDKVAQAADAELNSPERLREELLAAQLRFELGEIDDRQLAELETDLLARMRELRAAEAAGPISFGGGEGPEIEVSFGGGEDRET